MATLSSFSGESDICSPSRAAPVACFGFLPQCTSHTFLFLCTSPNFWLETGHFSSSVVVTDDCSFLRLVLVLWLFPNLLNHFSKVCLPSRSQRCASGRCSSESVLGHPWMRVALISLWPRPAIQLHQLAAACSAVFDIILGHKLFCKPLQSKSGSVEGVQVTPSLWSWFQDQGGYQ